MARSSNECNNSSKFLNPDPWVRLIGRANEEKIRVNGNTVTALLDTGSQVAHISIDYCQAMGIPINPIEQTVNIEGAGGNAIEYVGFIEADLTFPMGTHGFKTEALLLVLPTTEYQKRVPITIGTSLTDMAVDSLGTSDPSKLSTPWKTVCLATQTRRKIQAQQFQKQIVKTTKPITLPPFSTTVVHGHTKLKSHGVRLNLIAEPFRDSQLPSNIQCTPTYCNLEPGSNRVTVGLRNISARKITVPSSTIVCQIQLANMVPPIQTSKEQPPTEVKREDDSCILDQLDLGEINTWSEEQQHAARKLLCDYSETFSKMI